MDNINRGNPIFRNQPSYREFNKSFEDAGDTLYSFLNEVDSEILKQEQEKESQVFTSYKCSFAQADPRTQEIVELSIYDHSSERLSYSFPNPQERYSVLSRPQQDACLRVLLAWQRNSDVDEADFVIWRATNKKRITEEQLVQKQIYEYANTQKERIYAPMKPLVLCYSKWFERFIKHILPTLSSANYVTLSGLPQLPQCKALNVETASMDDIRLVCRKGHVRLWPEIALKQQELSTLRVRLERYACAALTAEEDMAAELENQLYDADEDVIVLPVDAILMLLTPGAYVDLPTEMLLNVREIPDGDYKSIEFQKPLPARNCGWHTNNHIVSQAYAAYAPTQWLQFKPDSSVVLVDDELVQDTENEMKQIDYKLQPIDENIPHIKPPKSNCALVSWRLRTDSDSEQGLQIYSTVSIAAVRDSLAKQPLGCHLIKLENKPDCGCEVMTKYELLSAWLQLKLLQTDLGHCTRVCMRDFVPLLEQQLTLEAIEQQLHELYLISMPQQLCLLHEFLKLLKGIVKPGEYLLRYTTKYKDKFLLCHPVQEATPLSFKLQDLLTATPPGNIDFLTETNNYLHISPKLCSRLHEEQQLLPCAFPTKDKGVRRSNRKVKENKKPVLTQRKRAVLCKTPVPRKRQKRSQRKRKRDAAKAQKAEDTELDKIMCL